MPRSSVKKNHRPSRRENHKSVSLAGREKTDATPNTQGPQARLPRKPPTPTPRTSERRPVNRPRRETYAHMAGGGGMGVAGAKGAIVGSVRAAVFCGEVFAA